MLNEKLICDFLIFISKQSEVFKLPTDINEYEKLEDKLFKSYSKDLIFQCAKYCIQEDYIDISRGVHNAFYIQGVTFAGYDFIDKHK